MWWFLILMVLTTASKHDFRRDWRLDFLITQLIEVFITASALGRCLLILTFLLHNWFGSGQKLLRFSWCWHLRHCLYACRTGSDNALFSDSTPPHFLFLLTFKYHTWCFRIEVSFLLSRKVTDRIHGHECTGWELWLILIKTRVFKTRSVVILSVWRRNVFCLLYPIVYTLDYAKLA